MGTGRCWKDHYAIYSHCVVSYLVTSITHMCTFDGDHFKRTYNVNTACTATYTPSNWKVSNISVISFSRFFIGFIGGSVSKTCCIDSTWWAQLEATGTKAHAEQQQCPTPIIACIKHVRDTLHSFGSTPSFSHVWAHTMRMSSQLRTIPLSIG